MSHLLDPQTVNCEFADAVQKQFQQRRFGIESCRNTEDLQRAIWRKQLFDWNRTDPKLPCCDLSRQ